MIPDPTTWYKNPWQPELANDIVRIRPLTPGHYEALYHAASDPLIWEQHPQPDRYQPAVFNPFFQGALQSGGAVCIEDVTTRAIIGTSRFYGFDPEAGRVAIGYTFLTRACWGGRYNAAVKELMLDHAFSMVGQVHFHIGPQNHRSQKAIQKLGALRIGTLNLGHAGEPPKLHDVFQITRDEWQWRQRLREKPNRYVIRRAFNDDIPEVKDVVFRALIEYGLQPDVTGVDQCLDDLEHFFFQQHGYFAVLISPSEDIIGTVGISLEEAGVYELKKMFLRPDYRGRGFGRWMMDHILDVVRGLGGHRIVLDTKQILKEAIGLYQSYGFRPMEPKVKNERRDMSFVLDLAPASDLIGA